MHLAWYRQKNTEPCDFNGCTTVWKRGLGWRHSALLWSDSGMVMHIVYCYKSVVEKSIYQQDIVASDINNKVIQLGHKCAYTWPRICVTTRKQLYRLWRRDKALRRVKSGKMKQTKEKKVSDEAVCLHVEPLPATYNMFETSRIITDTLMTEKYSQNIRRY